MTSFLVAPQRIYESSNRRGTVARASKKPGYKESSLSNNTIISSSAATGMSLLELSAFQADLQQLFQKNCCSSENVFIKRKNSCTTKSEMILLGVTTPAWEIYRLADWYHNSSLSPGRCINSAFRAAACRR